MPVLALHNITKYYGRLQALSNVSFSVPEGSVFGILGPNGSGKTTLLGIVTDVLKATSGTYTLFDTTPIAQCRRRIGTLLETPNFYHYLSIADNLAVTAALRGSGREQIDEVLATVGLLQRKRSKFSDLSLGMKQRLAIGAALLGDPQVLMLDEPTNGLDPVGIAEVRALIRRLAETGKTIIMASHLLDEVEKVCTHVAILKTGKLLTAGPVNEVLANEDTIELGCADMEALRALISRFPVPVKSWETTGNRLQLVFSDPVSPAALNAFCFQEGITLDHLQLKRKSLESIFIALTATS